MAINPYEILRLDPNCQQDEIKLSYRKLAKKLHPDLNPGNKRAEERFKELSLAYELIGTPEARAKYDKGEVDEKLAREAHSQRGPFYNETQQGGGRYSSRFEGMDEDFLNSIFSQAGRAQKQERSTDELYQMSIDFKDSILGAEREISLPTGKKFLVKIPAGVESGVKLRFPGKSASGADVYVQLSVLPSPIFKRIGQDLESEVFVPLSSALLGGEIEVPTIEGTILLKIPPNISAAQKMRVAGRGVPQTDGKRGSQIVKLQIKMPEKIDDVFKEAVVAWSKRDPSGTEPPKGNL